LSFNLEGRKLGEDLHPPDVPVQIIAGGRAEPDEGPVERAIR
jgi:hypothetical protein